jgi:hypothetical protein
MKNQKEACEALLHFLMLRHHTEFANIKAKPHVKLVQVMVTKILIHMFHKRHNMTEKVLQVSGWTSILHIAQKASLFLRTD